VIRCGRQEFDIAEVWDGRTGGYQFSTPRPRAGEKFEVATVYLNEVGRADSTRLYRSEEGSPYGLRPTANLFFCAPVCFGNYQLIFQNVTTQICSGRPSVSSCVRQIAKGGWEWDGCLIR
jgi:hypothetical protein